MTRRTTDLVQEERYYKEGIMWQDTFERLIMVNEAQDSIFWPEVDREMEHAMLRQLFTTAVARNVLTNEQVEQFLSEVSAVNAPELREGAEPIPAPEAPCDLSAATRKLLNVDEKLSPLSLMMFGKRLLPQLDREMLMCDLEATCEAGVYSSCA